ncbi:hypothetical protein A9K55_007702 [Cordyceps militaris]|uniref:DUF7053 domain-containing protein n=1 Tax=Cordyceps militaris TaxID=73501 RepID=A0A2H4SI41_CORMI|nr:hypothetical protein A9K55_007702 [Cordyceps militaris]
MSKKSTFTSVTPLPAGMTRQAAVDFLQDHEAMIDLNPLVTGRQRMPAAPADAPADERPCAWYEVTDRIDYLPGGLARGSVRYRCAFLDLPGVGLQTHCYAPMGVDLRTRWSVAGSAPGEPREAPELGIGAPPTGLYLREDTELRCSLVMAAFVRRTLRDAHKRLADRLTQRGARDAQDAERRRLREAAAAAAGMGREHGEGEQQPLNSHRISSYYVQREAEAGRRRAGAAATDPRNANYHQSGLLTEQRYVSEDGPAPSHGMYAGGGNNNTSCSRQHHGQETQQYHEADATRDPAELP